MENQLQNLCMKGNLEEAKKFLGENPTIDISVTITKGLFLMLVKQVI
jgi:hypothetical protein